MLPRLDQEDTFYFLFMLLVSLPLTQTRILIVRIFMRIFMSFSLFCNFFCNKAQIQSEVTDGLYCLFKMVASSRMQFEDGSYFFLKQVTFNFTDFSHDPNEVLLFYEAGWQDVLSSPSADRLWDYTIYNNHGTVHGSYTLTWRESRHIEGIELNSESFVQVLYFPLLITL